MPVEVLEHPLTAQSPEHFARVLREQPEKADRLSPAADRRALEARFNDRPVGVLIATREAGQWRIETLVVHPATRGRGVGTSLLAGAAKHLGELQIPDELAGLAGKAGLGEPPLHSTSRTE